MRIPSFLKASLATLVLGASLAAHAQQETIKLLVGFPPGGSTDTLARLMADKLGPLLKQPVVVDNKPGAGGRIAAQALKASAPDGLTYMVAPNATPVFQALLYPASVLRFDVLQDFTPVGMLASYPLALAVSPQVPAKTAAEYVQWLKANPAKTSFGTAGAGGQTHFSGVQFGKATGLDMQVVPYRGNGPLITDLVGGQVPAGVLTAGDILPQQKAGRVKVLGVFGAKRSPLLPDVPTLLEQGISVDTGDAWTGVWAPAKTPKVQLERMQRALKEVLAMPDVRETMQKLAFTPDFRPGEEVDAIERKELAYWGPIIKASGFTPEQ
jgi:tripartite-type tricarboxylate transporter receptor subunit TctC